MANAAQDFLRALKRTINGDPYPSPRSGIYKADNYRVKALRDPLAGSLLGNKYRVLARVGKGAMAIVYKASQEPIDRVVALKVLNSTYSQDPIAVKRFNLEAKTLSALKHRNILSIHDIGTIDSNQPFFVMEFLDGITLENLIEDRGAVPISRSVQIFAQVCDAMSYAHKQGLIHRDLKPGNIMLVKHENGDEIVKLVDFGIVKIKSSAQQRLSQRLTKKGEVWGSPTYMSPEQCMGKELDARSDIYSMGLLMYETLLGVEAFDGEHVGQIVSRQIGEMPAAFKLVNPVMRIPERLEAIVFKCIQKKPEERYQSMDELKAELEAFSRKHGIKLMVSSGMTRQDLLKASGTPGDQSRSPSFQNAEAKPAKETPEAAEAGIKDDAKSKPAVEPAPKRKAAEASFHSARRTDENQENAGFPSRKKLVLLISLLALAVITGSGICLTVSMFNKSSKSNSSTDLPKFQPLSSEQFSTQVGTEEDSKSAQKQTQVTKTNAVIIPSENTKKLPEPKPEQQKTEPQEPEQKKSEPPRLEKFKQEKINSISVPEQGKSKMAEPVQIEGEEAGAAKEPVLKRGAVEKLQTRLDGQDSAQAKKKGSLSQKKQKPKGKPRESAKSTTQNGTGSLSELEVLERTHLRKKRKNSDQQWLDLQDKLGN